MRIKVTEPAVKEVLRALRAKGILFETLNGKLRYLGLLSLDVVDKLSSDNLNLYLRTAEDRDRFFVVRSEWLLLLGEGAFIIF